MGFFGDIADAIFNAVETVLKFIRRLFVKVLNFFKNIVAFFKDPQRLERLRRERNLIATTVKRNLENGNFNTVSCLFDKSTNKIVDEEEIPTDFIEAETLDSETAKYFGDKDMIVLN